MTKSASPHAAGVHAECHEELKQFIIESTGLTYYADRDEDLAQKIERRLSKHGIGDYASYLDLLRNSPEGEREFDALVAELTIGETYFFRHQEQFDALRHTVLPEILNRKRHDRRLRIWSAGCATGPEPYSLSILLRREFAHLLEGWEVQILGTDINRGFLAAAMEGIYDEWAFRSCPAEIKQACFVPSGNAWALAPEYKKWTSFQYHNLVKHSFPSLLHNLSAFDLILCRNVMIYFSAEIIRKLVEQFHRTLLEGGWLLVGHAEPNMESFHQFHALSVPGTTLYQKKAGPMESSFPFPFCPPSFPEPRPLESWQEEKKLQEPGLPSFPPIAPAPLPEAPPPELARIRQAADQGEWETAAQDCRNLLEREKLNPTAHFYQALIFKQMGKDEEAERSFRHALYLDRSFVLAHYCLGLCLEKKGDFPAAMRSFQNVINLLAGTDSGRTFTDWDGITAADLKELAEMNLNLLQER